MLATAAARRHGEDILTRMNVSAASASAAFTGNQKPLDAIEKAIRGSSSRSGGELQNRLKAFARKVGAKGNNGSDRR